MKIIANKDYKDTFENKIIRQGETYETTDARANYIVERGFANFVNETKSFANEIKVENIEVDKTKTDKKETKKRRR